MRQSLEPICRDPLPRIVLNAADITCGDALPETRTSVGYLGKRKVLFFTNAAYEITEGFHER